MTAIVALVAIVVDSGAAHKFSVVQVSGEALQPDRLERLRFFITTDSIADRADDDDKTDTAGPRLLPLGDGRSASASSRLLVVVDPDGAQNFGTFVFWALAVAVLIGELLPLEIPRPSGDGEVTISTMFSFALLLARRG